MSAAPVSPLLPLVAAGDARAVKECISRYGGLVYSLASRFLKDADEVDDACQEIFVALWRSAAAFDPSRGSEVTFVALIARRRLIDRHRTPGTRPLPVTDEPAPASAAILEDYVDSRNAMAALDQCSVEQRRVILLSAFRGLTHEEISAELGLPLGTVKSHYKRGIERIKRALGADEGHS